MSQLLPVGYKGQRFQVVQYVHESDSGRHTISRVWGWTNQLGGGDLARAVELHPDTVRCEVIDLWQDGVRVMPHDSAAKPVTEGNVVTLKAKVSNVSPGEKACNCTFTVIVPPGVDEEYAPSFSGNTRLGFADPADATDTAAPHPAVQAVFQFFAYAHLPEHLRLVSEPFYRLACRIVNGPQNQEATVALRKLLEAKDAAVRAVLFKS